MHQARILRQQGWSQQAIAKELGVTDRTIRNYLAELPRERKTRQSAGKLDAFKPLIDAIIADEPYYNNVILFERIVNLGYAGQMSILKAYVHERRSEVTRTLALRFETEPGRQAQVDWKDAGRWNIDGVRPKVYAFVMTLGYSRRTFVRFTTRMDSSTLLACHQKAFEYFEGIPAEILYDNMKTAWIQTAEGSWVPQSRLLAFASFHGFRPLRCQIRRPQTKGKVERSIGYLSTNFLPRAIEQGCTSLDELNDMVMHWLVDADQKPLTEFRQNRIERFGIEQPRLTAYRTTQIFDCRDVHELLVSREGLISFQGNRYSVPASFLGKRLTLKIDPLSTSAELFAGREHVRDICMASKGAGQKLIRPEDRETWIALWRKQNQRKKIVRQRAATPVSVRSPSWYETLVGGGSDEHSA